MRVGIVVSVIVMSVSLPMQFFATKPASAADYDAEIQALRNKISGYEDEASALSKKANTLQNVLNQISADKTKIQAEVDLYQAEYNKLVKEIKDTEDRIAENRRVSGELIVQSSLSNDVPLIVRLASSNNLADYIDGEASRISVRDTIVQKTEENEKLKIELKDKQAEVKKVLDAQKLKRDELASKEATQAQLIRETKNNEASYQEMIKQGQSQIEEYQRMQEELRRLRAQGAGGGTYVATSGTGGYPYDHIKGCYTNACADPWRLFYSECTSYVAWKLSSKGYGVKPFNWRGSPQGNAYEWTGSVTSYAVSKRTHSPKAGDALVFPAYTHGAAWTGHVMYVEKVYGNGTILISEYNWDGYGNYSERELAPGEYSGGTFITFPRR